MVSGHFRSLSVDPVLLGKYWQILPCVPLAVLANYAGGGAALTFFLSVAGFVPLTERLAFTTEQLATRTNAVVAGLLTASCGNASELIISGTALFHEYHRLIQLSLLGSVLTNLLFVLGMAFVVGGSRHQVENISRSFTSSNAGLLILFAVALMLPSRLHETDLSESRLDAELWLSRAEAVFMLACYGAYVYYQFAYHPGEKVEPPEEGMEAGGVSPAQTKSYTTPGLLCLLASTTVCVTILASFICDAVAGASSTLGIPAPFATAVILPLIGNSSESVAAIYFASKQKINLSISVVLGSSVQVSLMVMPLSVLASWLAGTTFDLNFNEFETVAAFSTVMLVSVFLLNEHTTWLKGATLLTVYACLASGFWVHKDQKLVVVVDGHLAQHNFTSTVGPAFG